MKIAILLLAILAFAQTPPKQGVRDGDVIIDIGEHKALTITVGPIDRPGMENLVSLFLGNNHKDAEKEFRKLLKECDSITLVLKGAKK